MTYHKAVAEKLFLRSKTGEKGGVGQVSGFYCKHFKSIF